jgi:hypothetical protein
MNTATWDETNPEDIICVVGANGKSQTIHGRSVAETQGRIPKVMVSEFRMSQPEADAFAEMAAAERGRPTEIDELRSSARGLITINRQQTRLIAELQDKVAAAEKDRDAAIAEKKILGTSLDQATAKIAELQKPPPAPPESTPETTDGKTEKPAA